MERAGIATIDGGPADTSVAHAAASARASVVILEKGVPRADRPGLKPDSMDATGILDYWVDVMDIHPDEFSDTIVLGILSRAEFIKPGESLTLRSTGVDSSYDEFGYTFHRVEFDDWLHNRAEDAGAEYRVKASMRDVEADLGVTVDDARCVVRLTNGEDVGVELVILTSDPRWTVTNKMLDDLLPFPITDRLSSTEVNYIAYQEHREFLPEPFDGVDGVIKFWQGYMFGHTVYPWVLPNDDSVCWVGLTVPTSLDVDGVNNRGVYVFLREDDERILQGHKYVHRPLEQGYSDKYDIDEDFPPVEDHRKTKETETYAIPSAQLIDSPVEIGIVVTDDVMGATSAFHEGDDHVAARTGAIAGELAVEGDLSDYNECWKEVTSDEILHNIAMAEITRDCGPAQQDKAFKAARELLEKDESHKALGVAKLSAGLNTTKLATQYQ